MNLQFNFKKFSLAFLKAIVSTLLLISLLTYIGTVKAKTKKGKTNQPTTLTANTTAETTKIPEKIESISDQTPPKEEPSKTTPMAQSNSVPKLNTLPQNTAATTTNTKSPTPPTTQKQPVTVTPSKSSEEQIVTAINDERIKAGLSPVIMNSILNQAAYAKSKDMLERNYFAHTAPDGTTDLDFIKSASYNYGAVGINLAEGDFGSNQEVVNAWMNSAGHKENILANYGQDIGIGICGKYYTMIIGKQLN